MTALADLWADLPAVVQDAGVTLGLVLPALLVGLLALRGYAPWPVIGAMLWRFRWANALFTALIAVSVGLGVGILAQERALARGTAAAADKFDLIVAAPGSEITAMLAAVFLQPSALGLLDGAAWEAVAGAEGVTLAAPLAFGDSVGRAPVVGTTAAFAAYLSGGAIEGRMFAAPQEAVAGAAAGLALGDTAAPAHGFGPAAEHGAHGGAPLRVVGRMAPTGTPWDRAILVPVEQVWAAHGLAAGHAPEAGDRLGPPFDAAYFPGTPAIVVQTDELWAAYALRGRFGAAPATMAFFPGEVLARLYAVMGDVRQAMSLLSLVTQGLVGASILTGLLILMRLFRRQLSLLRALGAPGRFVFAVVWGYATVLLASGAVLGLGLGWVAARGLSALVTARTDVAVAAALGWGEVQMVAGFVSLAGLLAVVPAAAVLRQGVVEGLRA